MGQSKSPNDFGQERQKAGQEVRNAQMQDEVVHPRQLWPAGRDGEDDGHVAQERQKNDHAQDDDFDVVERDVLSSGVTAIGSTIGRWQVFNEAASEDNFLVKIVKMLQKHTRIENIYLS